MNATQVTHPSPIQVLRSHHDRLDALVERTLSGRDAALAEQLETELDRATVVEEQPADVVGMDDRVTYVDEGTGLQREVTLAYPGQTDSSAGRISILTPIGVALLGLSVGDHFDQTLPDGRVARLRILSVRR